MKSKGDSTLYRQIAKGTAVFGGSQIITILSNTVKGKFTAVFLSDFGMGVSSLLNSALMPIQQLFSFGLPTSGVKEIASATDAEAKAHTAIALRRVLYILGIMGMVFMIMFSPMLSTATFGNRDYTLWFVFMSFALLFFVLTAGENSILQGFRRLKALAVCNIVGALCGLLISVPLYYFYGTDGIVPSMIVLSLTTFCFARYSTCKIQILPVRQSWSVTWSRGKVMLLLGGILMISSVIGAMTTYLLNTFIRSYGTISDVGLFQAANAISLQCTSMVFTAMATDYYPHLSSVINKKSEMLRLIEQQGEIVLLVIAPITALLIVFSPLIVRVLLTQQFDTIVPLLRLIALSLMGRAFCFPLDYVCLSKGDNSFFFWFEGVWGNTKTFLLSVLGYYLFGLIGLGYALLVSALIDVFVSALLCKIRYDVSYTHDLFRVFLPLLLLNVMLLAASFIPSAMLRTAIMLLLLLCICTYTFVQLNRRIEIKNILKRSKHQR